MPARFSSTFSYLPLPLPLQAPLLGQLGPEGRALFEDALRLGTEGAAALEQGDHSRAKVLLQTCLQSLQNADMADAGTGERLALARCHAELHEFPEALTEARRARDSCLRRGDHRYVLGCSLTLAQICLRAGDLGEFASESRVCIEDALTLAPETVQELLVLHVQFLDVAFNHPEPMTQMRTVLEVLSNVSQRASVILAASSVLSKETYDEVRTRLGLLETVNERLGLTMSAWSRAAELHTEGQLPQSLVALSHSLRFAEAVFPWERPKPLLAALLLFRGRTHEDLGDFHRALADYDRALKLQPDNARLRRCRGALYTKLRKYRRALRDFDAASGLEPDDRAALLSAASLLLTIGRFSEAVEKVALAEKLDPADKEAILLRAKITEATGHEPEAKEAYDAAVGIEAVPGSARYQRMLFHAAKNRWTLAARDQIALAASSSPELMSFSRSTLLQLLFRACDECSRVNMQSEDLRCFAEAMLAIDRESDKAFAFRGLFHWSHQRLDEALDDFSEAIRLNAGEFRHFLYRGQVYDAKGDRGAAHRDYAHVVSLDPAAPDLRRRT